MSKKIPEKLLVIFLKCISIVLQIGLKLLKDIQDTVGGWLLPQGA